MNNRTTQQTSEATETYEAPMSARELQHESLRILARTLERHTQVPREFAAWPSRRRRRRKVAEQLKTLALGLVAP